MVRAPEPSEVLYDSCLYAQPLVSPLMDEVETIVAELENEKVKGIVVVLMFFFLVSDDLLIDRIKYTMGVNDGKKTTFERRSKEKRGEISDHPRTVSC